MGKCRSPSRLAMTAIVWLRYSVRLMRRKGVYAHMGRTVTGVVLPQDTASYRDTRSEAGSPRAAQDVNMIL